MKKEYSFYSHAVFWALVFTVIFFSCCFTFSKIVKRDALEWSVVCGSCSFIINIDIYCGSKGRIL